MKSKIKFTTRFIYCCSFQFQVLCRNFLNATNSKDRPTVDAKNSAKCGANLLVEHWKHWTPITKVTMPSLWDFADPQGEFNKFHSLLGSVLVDMQEKKLWRSSPFLQSHLWNLQKSSRHVTSRNQPQPGYFLIVERGPWERGWSHSYEVLPFHLNLHLLLNLFCG